MKTSSHILLILSVPTDLMNPASFRDLSKPIGALNTERLDRLLVRRNINALLASLALCLAQEVSDSSWMILEDRFGDSLVLCVGTLQRHARPSLHVRESLLISGLRAFLSG